MTEFEAVLARLEMSGYDVYDSVATHTDGRPFPPPYLVVYGGSLSRVDAGRLTAVTVASSDREHSFTVRAVGLDPRSARILDAVAANLLIGWTATVTGRTCGPVRHDGADPVDTDRQVDPPVFYADHDYILPSSR